jgi:hypothetical protein
MAAIGHTPENLSPFYPFSTMRLLRALLIAALFATSFVARAADTFPVRSVALVPAADPIEYTLTSRTAAVFIFPIASAGAWADSRDKTRAFTALTKSRQPAYGAYLSKLVADRLRAAGYQVRLIEPEHRDPADPDGVDLEALVFDEDIGMQLQFDTMGFFSDMGTMGFAPKVNVDAHSFLHSGAENPFSTTIYYGVDARPNKDWAIMAPDTANIPSFEVLMGEPERVDAVYRDALNLLAERIATQFMASSPLKAAAAP